jgi:hypothetical protein
MMTPDLNNITLTDGQRRWIATRAARVGVSSQRYLAGLIPSADLEGQLQSATNGYETALQAAERLGLVGCVVDAPPDLATNPKYMEGFGQDDTVAHSR